MLQIQRQAALVAVRGHELPAHAAVAELAGVAPPVAGQRLDLDDLRAPVAQGHGAERAEQDGGQIEDPDALEWACRLRESL